MLHNVIKADLSKKKKICHMIKKPAFLWSTFKDKQLEES